MSDLLNSASLVMIPSGYKEDVVYSQIPTDGSGDLSFTRASNGTRVNSAGLVEVVPWNLVEYSEDFTNAYWPKSNSTVSANTTTAPNGTLTADKLVENTANNSHSILSTSTTATVGVNYVSSIYAKAGERNWVLVIYFDGSTVKGRYFDLTNGVGGSYWASASITNSITSVGDGWYRITLSYSATSTSNILGVYLANTDNNVSYTGNGTSGVYIWGAQLNIGSTAKPYFPTTDRLNVPRLTYQNGGGGCPSLLLEKQSTNLFTYSEQMDNADWYKTNLTITANATTSPDGTQNADLLDDGTASSTQHWIYQGPSFANSTAYTISFYAKYVSRKYMAVNIYNGATSQYVTYDIQNGVVVGSTGDVTASIISIGNGWYRVVYTRTMASSGSPNFRIALADDNGDVTYTGSNKQLYLWGMQCEASSYATSYIPTTSSSATRVVDACYKTGISSLIGQTEGVLFVDFNFENTLDVNGSIVMIIYGTGGEAFIYINGGSLLLQVYNSGVVQGNISISIGAVGRKKIAFAYKQNDFVGYMNGTQIGTDTSGTIPAMSTLRLGEYYATGYSLNSGINQAILFPTRLTNAELASLTTI